MDGNLWKKRYNNVMMIISTKLYSCKVLPMYTFSYKKKWVAMEKRLYFSAYTSLGRFPFDRMSNKSAEEIKKKRGNSILFVSR